MSSYTRSLTILYEKIKHEPTYRDMKVPTWDHSEPIRKTFRMVFDANQLKVDPPHSEASM